MRTAPILLASFVLAASACSANGGSASPDVTGVRPSTPDPTQPVDYSTPVRDDTGTTRFRRALTPFDDCSAFLDHVQAEARSRVGPYGLDGDPWAHWLDGDIVMMGDEATVEMTAEAAVDASTAPDGGLAGDSDTDGQASTYTGTNVQELGVDEPDIIKTDGDRILAVSEDRLTYIDITGDPIVADAIDVPEGWGHELFIRGDRALLFTNGGQWEHPMPVEVVVDDTDAEAEFASEEELSIIAPDHFTSAAVILEVDLSDPGDLDVVSTMRVEGRYLSARAIGERVRLVVTSPPNQLPWLHPQNQFGEDRATEANREIIDESSLDDWVPSYELTTDGTTTAAPLLSCDRAHRPAEFSGFDVISVVDLDLAAGLADSVAATSAVGVLAGGDTVYSSTDRMYVATTKWVGADVVNDPTRLSVWNEEFETDLHAFAISPGEPTQYVASGTVEGSLLNQFSLDEHDGYLRAITTTGSPWNQEQTSESHLVVLEEQGDLLTIVGEVGGLGKGEQLHSARLMGDVGFAVTFRQIDPFYVLDLSDPTDPKVTGELKIPGVSTYLHPVGDDRVLGVGQQATEDGRTTGLKLSLFDVSDPAMPREVDVWTLEGAHSPAEWDHRAFQMWDTTAIVPAQTWDNTFNGAVLFDIGDDITEVGRVSHVADDAAPTSDCRTLTTDDVPENSELWWMVNDAYGHVQLCDETDRGGYGSWMCEQIPLDDIQNWIGDPEVADDLITWLGDDGDRIEMCWPDGGYQEAIQRSLVVDGTLWTMTNSAIQANALDGLSVLDRFPLR